MRCNDCRPLILDHLYGLLDAPEAAAVDAHVASCEACAAVRAEAAKVQGLFAAAAKGTFPAVRFDTPAPKSRPSAPAAPARGATSASLQADARPARAPLAANPPSPVRGAATGRGTVRLARALPWAVAAAVLLAVPGTVVPVLRVLDRAETARRAADSARAEADAAAAESETARREVGRAHREAEVSLAAARQAHDGILARWVAEEKGVAQTLATRRLTWDVRKPVSVQPGAPNEFLVVVRDRGAEPGGRVVAEFRDQTDAVVYSQPIDHARRHEHTVRLPAAAWADLKPDSELFLVVTREDEKTREKTVVQDKVRLMGPVYATVLTTDRPAYRPGDTVFFRSLTLDRATFTPPAREQLLRYELRGPTGAVVRVEGGTELVRIVEGKVELVRGPDGKPVRGVGCGSFALPADAPDGEYTLVLHESPLPGGGPPVVPVPVTRPIRVRSAAAEAYRKSTGYVAASYSAGDTVEAWAELKFKDRPVVGAEVRAVAVADDQVLDAVQVQPPVTDANGRANLRFTLPPELDRGDVRLKVTFFARTGQNVVEETVADRVPVVGRNVVVEFFPEGGDLVAGVPCRVYVRATTPTGHPVDFAGTVTDGRRTLAAVKSVTDPAEPGANRGIGSFTFTPELGTPLWLNLDSPAGAYSPLLVPENGRFPVAAAGVAGAPAVAASRTGFPLPEVKAEGVVMRVPTPVTRPGEPIRVRLYSVARARNLVVGAYTRGRLSDTQRVSVEPGRPEQVELMAGTDPRGGVVRITVFEEPEGFEKFPGAADGPKPDLNPVAERLVFRRPGEALNLAFTTNGAGARGEGFAPGSPVRLDVAATDEKGNPAAAILYAAAVNTAVAPGPKDRLLTTHFLLAGEVNTPDELEYADFLLTDGEQAAAALDGVLATQGWRRFAEQTPEGFAREPVAATTERANLLVCNGQYLTPAEPSWAREHRRIRDQYWPLYEAAVKNLDRAKEAAAEASADWSGLGRAERLAADATRARREAGEAVDRAASAGAAVERVRGLGWYAVGGFGLLAVALGFGSFVASAGRLPLGIGTAGAVGIAGFLVVSLGLADSSQAAGHEMKDVAPAAAPAKASVPEVAPEPRLADEANVAVAPLPPGRPPLKGVFGGGRGGGFGGGGAPIFGVGPAFPIAPPAIQSNASDKADAKDVVRPGGGGPMAGAFAPRDPAAVGGMPTAGAPGGLRYGDGGWKPYRGANAIPLPAEAEMRRLQRANVRAGFGGGAELGMPGVGAVPVPAPAPVGGPAVAAPVARPDLNTDDLNRRAREYAEAVRDSIPKLPPEVAAVVRPRTPAAPVTPLVVREYAAPRPRPTDVGAAVLPDTVLWQPVVVLPADGKTTLAFQVGGAPGGYQVVVAGHTLDGRIGAVRGIIPVAAPAPAAPKKP